MSFAWVEGFESFGVSASDTQDGIEEKYAASTGMASATVEIGRVSGLCVRLPSGALMKTGAVLSDAEVCVGFAIRRNSGTSTVSSLFRVHANALPTALWDISPTSGGALQLRQQLTVRDSDTDILSDGNWHYVVFHIFIDAVSGFARVYVDDDLYLAFSGDTYGASPEAGPNITRFGFAAGSGNTWDIDDLYVFGGGEYTNQCAVNTLFPTSDSSVAFSPSTGSDNYAVVDDVPADEDSSYVESGTTGHTDLYGVGTLSAGPIDCVQVNLRVRGTIGGEDVKPTLHTGGSEYAVANPTTLTTSFVECRGTYTQNPDTSAGWQTPEVNATTFGQKVA